MRSRFHGLKQPRIRQTWNKHNLYNLSRYRGPNFLSLTFYQQKWKSKSTSRAYHGEQIREKQWQRMFRPRAAAVIPMDYRYLGDHDGSELAAGRGSGKEIAPDLIERRSKRQIPYMSMVYAPIERRLDTAIFRALFASSARQARQFVVHGKVKVNGKKMPYPGYLLNPGDMFQVDPEAVLFGTGAQKSKKQIVKGRGIRKSIRARNLSKAQRAESVKEVENTEEEADASPATPSSTSEDPKKAGIERRRTQLQDLRAQAQALLADGKSPPSGRRKQELRQITRSIRNTFSQVAKMSTSEIDSLIAKFSKRLILTPLDKAAGSEISEVDEAAFKEAVRRARENPIDDSKPYATPWQPRPYMSAFAFIPRYLEVNQNICSAVYIRHPVARPGLAEVPSPFSQEVMQLAHNWYLRRR
ncbi:hypothetical protein CJF32_00001811 [Rutstroemia sp. NJR-2017a WRK4]|nr:hypothetical protein CJF32_00001811 [Rutstroemia sp. NJR-2017a WRK4]